MLGTVWQKLKVGATTAALTAAVGVPVSFMGSISHNDALAHLGWIDGAAVADATPGQFYIVKPDGRIQEPLCSITETDFAPLERVRPGIRFRNLFGRSLPETLRTAAAVGPAELEWSELRRQFAPTSFLLFHNQRILEERDLDRIAEEAPDELHEALRLETCALAVVAALRADFHVCQLNDVIRNARDDKLLAVDFASLCLSSETNPEPRRLPEPAGRSLWAGAKQTLDLIDAAPL